MRLRIEAPNKAPYWFVGSPNVNVRQFAEAMELGVTIQRQQQQIPGAGQELADFEDRGNQRVTIQATTVREFSSAIDRMDFLAQLAPADAADRVHEWQGDVWLREEAGAAFAEWLLADAVVSLAAVDPLGAVALRLRYSVQAGGFGAKQQSEVADLLFRNSLEAASKTVTLVELQAQETAFSITNGDWMDVILQWPNGAGVSRRLSLGSGGDVPLPFGLSTMALVKGAIDPFLGIEGLPGSSLTLAGSSDEDLILETKTFLPTIDGRGADAFVSLALGRGTTTLFAWSDSGSESRDSINVLPDNEDLTINTPI